MKMLNKVSGEICAIALLFFSHSAFAKHFSEIIPIHEGTVHVSHWGADNEEAPSVILLSGPTDYWNSDSAWFARLGPLLGKNRHVIAIDRAGQILKHAGAKVGYVPFADDLAGVISHLKIQKANIVAFASANLTVNVYLGKHTKNPISHVIMIDPDVLNTYSINRYKKDALGFKTNFEAYQSYIADGKYQTRAQQKNELELAHLKTLVDQDFNWQYLNLVYATRLDKVSLQNLFREIARYDQDLDEAAKAGFPESMSLTVFDTDFEQAYIDASEKEDERSELDVWRQDAKSYYQKLTNHSINGTYIPLKTKEHLLPFSDPQLIIDDLDRNTRQ